jgi:hypothetical protein
MLNVIASARATYDPDEQTLTFAIPDEATKGDVLLVLVARADTSSVAAGVDWTNLGSASTSGITTEFRGRMIDGEESGLLVLDLDATGDEVQGSLVVLRGAGTLPLLVEASASLGFAATLTPGSPSPSSLQAINLTIEVWSSGSSLTLTAPEGHATIDTFASALVASRTILVTSRRANGTGVLALGAAGSSANATGASFALVLRDNLPMTPEELYDPVPGNIGLLGKDNRPPREVA